MLLKKKVIMFGLLLLSFNLCEAQIEVAYAKAKDFQAIGFGGFLNFSLPVSEGANYITIEGGVQYFKNKYDEDLGLVPVLAGYRYTLDQSGTGLYVEPYAGYSFGASTIGVYDENGGWMGEEAKVSGPAAGIGAGYLVELGGIFFNAGLRYQHNFGALQTNVFAFRISHSFSFRRRSDD